jgi:hypothetical protein
MKQIARHLHWHGSSSLVFGSYKGYFFTMFDGQGFKEVLVKIVGADADNISKLSAAIDAKKKDLSLSDILIDSNWLHVKVRERFRSASVQRILDVLDSLVEALKMLNLPSSSVCFECGGNRDLATYIVSYQGALLCPSCFERVAHDFEIQLSASAAEQKFYTRGFIGAFLFALAGIVLWVIVALLSHRVFAAMAFVFTYLSLKGYDFFKAKRGRLTPWIILTVNVLAVVFSVVSTYFIQVVQKGIVAENALYVIFNNNKVLLSLLKDLAISAIVCVLAWIAIGASLFKAHNPSRPKLATIIE